MRPISYSRVADADSAIAVVSSDADSAYLAGGTNQVDLLRIYVEQPARLVDINDLPLRQIDATGDGGLRIGALARMSDVAQAPLVHERFRMISQSLLLGASPQLRNMASIGGNLLQRTRCAYFRDRAAACNKRNPGSGCAAMHGVNRGHAVLGASDHCIATHPSDLGVALVALDAVVRTRGASGGRDIAIDDFYLLPGSTPEREHPLNHGELIVEVEVPPVPAARRSLYLKVRDRESYEFALASVAVGVVLADRTITEVRLALGGVGTKPWRARQVERMLTGAAATMENFTAAAQEEMRPAIAHGMNEFKIELGRRLIVRALQTVTDDAWQTPTTAGWVA